MEEKAICEICGEPMPEGEEMFKFHGYSGNCPKPPKKKDIPSHHLEEMREEFLERFFEPTFIDAKPYDNSYEDDEKIDWWLSKFSSLQQKIEDRIKILTRGTMVTYKELGVITSVADAQHMTVEELRGVLALFKKENK